MVAGFASGTPLYHLLARQHYSAALEELKRLSNMLGMSSMKVLWRYLIRGRLKQVSPNVLRQYVSDRRSENYYKRYLEYSLIDPEFAESVNLKERLLGFEQSFSAGGNVSHAEQHAQRIQHPSIMMAIERYERVARLYGIEARHPLLDCELLTFCVSLPPRLKNDGQFDRPIMRQALERHLPDDIVWRRYSPSDHLAPSFRGSWLDKNRKVLQSLINDNEHIASYFDEVAIHRKLKEPQSNDLLWSLSSFILWLMYR